MYKNYQLNKILLYGLFKIKLFFYQRKRLLSIILMKVEQS